jgi:hypothetical protein
MRRKEKKGGKNNSNITKPRTTGHKSKTNQQQEAVQQRTTENDLAFRWSFLSRTSSFPIVRMSRAFCVRKRYYVHKPASYNFELFLLQTQELAETDGVIP